MLRGGNVAMILYCLGFHIFRLFLPNFFALI